VRYPFAGHSTADLVVDAVYEGGPHKHLGAEPIAKLLPVGTQGGFRFCGSPREGTVRLAVLFTTGSDPDWPDTLDPQAGEFTYWGDNKSPGSNLHETRRGGNLLLRDAFNWADGSREDRSRVPPFLIFEREGSWDVRFRGLAVPGSPGKTPSQSLVAVWRSRGTERFQNYRANFTVLDIPRLSRSWLTSIVGGENPQDVPQVWTDWVCRRRVRALRAEPTILTRTKEEQQPKDDEGIALLSRIHGYFVSDPHGFERAALELWRMSAPATATCQLTQRSRDGGVDAWGTYRLGSGADPVTVDFALEAKCWSLDSAVGVKPMSRLISRLRHRQFGVFVTTSYFNKTVYKEVRSDGHPIVLMAGGDIVEILRSHGFNTPEAVARWLDSLS